MPRKRKPGPRENRSDLPAVAPGRPYGARAESEAALAAVPTDGPGLPAPSQMPGGAGGGGVPEEDMMGGFLEAAQAMEPPGQGLLAGDPENPEDITSGMDIGPGGGSEMLPDVAHQGPDPAIGLWRTSLPALGLIASMPGSSSETRQLYRRLRSQVPPDHHEQIEGSG